MTRHLQEGLLVALRDGFADPQEEEAVRAHLAACGSCREDLAALEARGSAVAGALETIDAFFDTAAARASVRVRVARATAKGGGSLPLEPRGIRGSTEIAGGSSRRGPRAVWIRAAGVVLFLGAAAAAAAALPGSPVRRWVHDLIPQAAPEPTAVDHPVPATAPTDESTGVRIGVAAGGLRVVLRGIPADGEVDVRWVPGKEAAVFGPVGSRFTSATGRLEATLTPGLVRVELPGDVVPMSLEVDGRIYLSNAKDGLRVLGPVIRRDEQGIVFRGGAP